MLQNIKIIKEYNKVFKKDCFQLVCAPVAQLGVLKARANRAKGS